MSLIVEIPCQPNHKKKVAANFSHVSGLALDISKRVGNGTEGSKPSIYSGLTLFT